MVFYATKGLISPLHNNRQKLKPGQYSLWFSFRHYFKGMCRHNLCNVTEEKKKSLQKLLNIENMICTSQILYRTCYLTDSFPATNLAFVSYRRMNPTISSRALGWSTQSHPLKSCRTENTSTVEMLWGFNFFFFNQTIQYIWCPVYARLRTYSTF